MNLKRHIKETVDSTQKATNYKKSLNSKKLNEKSKVIKTIMDYNDEELNNLEYNLALEIDKRNYCQYYLSLLNTKHALLFTFCNNNDYNLKIIKIDLFLINFVLFFTINALFFNDDTMHKIYKNKGSLDFIEQFPQTIYSYLISSIFTKILEILALTEDVILDIKSLSINSKNVYNKRIKNIGYKIKIKFFLYFIISTIFLIFFWYYISMFCAIYANTQIHLIEDTILSFILSLIEPCFLLLVPGIFRIPSLSNKYNNRYMLYKMSQILQKIIII